MSRWVYVVLHLLFEGQTARRDVVRRRPNPATCERLKTSHLEEVRFGFVALAAACLLQEAADGESTQDGFGDNGLHASGPGLVTATNRSRTRDRPGDGASLCPAARDPKTSRGASRLSGIKNADFRGFGGFKPSQGAHRVWR